MKNIEVEKAFANLAIELRDMTLESEHRDEAMPILQNALLNMLAAIELAEQCAGINGFLIDTAGMNPRPAVVCADGFEFYVRAGNVAFCSPQDDDALAYETCEIRFPSEAEVLFLPYIDFEDEDPTDTIYPYVPVEVIDQVIKKHGGFKD